jgi:phytoene dehydrogenase-like protein
MSEKSIIIGTGLARLSTGCYARLNGYSIRIFEHHSKTGGKVQRYFYSGWQVVQIICHKDNKQFSTNIL